MLTVDSRGSPSVVAVDSWVIRCHLSVVGFDLCQLLLSFPIVLKMFSIRKIFVLVQLVIQRLIRNGLCSRLQNIAWLLAWYIQEVSMDTFFRPFKSRCTVPLSSDQALPSWTFVLYSNKKCKNICTME